MQGLCWTPGAGAEEGAEGPRVPVQGFCAGVLELAGLKWNPGKVGVNFEGEPALTLCPQVVEQWPRSTGTWGGCEGGVLQT